MATIETEHLLPSELPRYLEERCAVSEPLPRWSVIKLCSLDEASVVVPSLSSSGIKPFLVWLPDTDPRQLLLLAQSHPEVECHTSADLRSHRSYLVWKARLEPLEVRLDTWAVAANLSRLTDELRAIFVGPGCAVASTLRMSPSEAEAFEAELQAAGCTSGPNWRPWRIYSDEEMKQVDGREDVDELGVLVPRLARLNH